MSLIYKTELLGGGVAVCVSKEHGFGTDSFLLADFASPCGGVVCDLCSGCGIVPLLMMRAESGPQIAYAVEIQAEAVEQLRQSAKINGLAERFFPIMADLRELKGALPLGAFDLVTCNPPYKACGTGLKSRADSDRIARHELLCTIADCCRAASRLLRFGGRFCLCQKPERLTDVLCAMRESNLEPKRVRFVQKDAHSAPWLVLVEGRLGGKPFLRVEPALTVYEGGSFSPEMMAIYGEYKTGR